MLFLDSLGRGKSLFFFPLHAQLKDRQLCKAERMLSIYSENKIAESFRIEQFKLVFLMKSSISKQNEKHSISNGEIRQRKIMLGWSGLYWEEAEHRNSFAEHLAVSHSPLAVSWTPSMFPWINLLHLLIFLSWAFYLHACTSSFFALPMQVSRTGACFWSSPTLSQPLHFSVSVTIKCRYLMISQKYQEVFTLSARERPSTVCIYSLVRISIWGQEAAGKKALIWIWVLAGDYDSLYALNQFISP